MLFILLAFAAITFMFAHGAILAQFIGTTNDTLMWLSAVQGAALLGAFVFLPAHLRSVDKPLWQKTDGFAERACKTWRRLPGWTIFATLIIVVNVLLGEIAILISRLTGHGMSIWQHTPTLSIVVGSIICMIAIAASSGPRPSRDQYGTDSYE